MLHDRNDAYRLLRELGAPGRLLLHVQLVGVAADRLVREYVALGVEFDARMIELGVALHDAGKIDHPGELDGPGSLHEPAGKALMLAHGVPAELAEYCVSHAAWHERGVSFEELSVALADKLWKGKRLALLEFRVIDEIAARLSVTRWDVFLRLDTVFEEVAAGADERLQRSGMIET